MANKALVHLLAHSKTTNSDESESSTSSDLSSIRSQFSEDEDEEDEIFFPLIRYLFRLRKKRVDDYLHVVEAWTETEFKNRLGLSRNIAHKLIDDLEKSGYIANHKFGLKPLEPRICFYIFLSFIANNEPLTPIATRFDISISSTFRVIRRVVAWILTKLDEVIKWPQNITDIKTVSENFQLKTGISNMLGVIDCTHVKIEKPKNARQYCNPKGYFSIILQFTIDANLKFTNIYCGEPGSSSCTRVLRKSPLYYTAIEEQSTVFPQNKFIIGHSGYPSLSWLIPPFRENKRLSLQQRDFNILHATARKLSDKACNMLKSKFRRIKLFSVYRNITFITDTIVAACILHNYCLSDNESYYS